MDDSTLYEFFKLGTGDEDCIEGQSAVLIFSENSSTGDDPIYKKYKIDDSFFDHQSYIELVSKNILKKRKIKKKLNPDLYKEATCSICLNEDCNYKTRCNHYFHAHCLEQWRNYCIRKLHKKKRYPCPYCKQGLKINYNNVQQLSGG